MKNKRVPSPRNLTFEEREKREKKKNRTEPLKKNDTRWPEFSRTNRSSTKGGRRRFLRQISLTIHRSSSPPSLSSDRNNGGRRARKISTGYRKSELITPPPLERSFFPFLSFPFFFENSWKGRLPRLLDERAFTRRGSMTNYELAVNEQNSLATLLFFFHESTAIIHDRLNFHPTSHSSW